MQLDDELVFGVVALGALRVAVHKSATAWSALSSFESNVVGSAHAKPIAPTSVPSSDAAAAMQWTGRQRRSCRRGSGKLRTVGGKVREQHCVAGASRRGDRNGASAGRLCTGPQARA